MHPHGLGYFYLKRLIDIALRSKRMAFDERSSKRIKRSNTSDTAEILVPSEEICWEAPSWVEPENREQWDEARSTLAQAIRSSKVGVKAARTRAEHLLRITDAITSQSVCESWKNSPIIQAQRPQGRPFTSTANAI